MVDLFNGTKVVIPLNNSVDVSYLNNTVNYIKSLVHIEPTVVIRKQTIGWVISFDLKDIFLDKNESFAIDKFFNGFCHIESSHSSNYMKLFTPPNLST